MSDIFDHELDAFSVCMDRVSGRVWWGGRRHYNHYKTGNTNHHQKSNFKRIWIHPLKYETKKAFCFRDKIGRFWVPKALCFDEKKNYVTIPKDFNITYIKEVSFG